MRVFNFTEQPYPDAWNLGFELVAGEPAQQVM